MSLRLIEYWAGANMLIFAQFAVSLFVTMVMLWLGLSILLGPERKNGGAWCGGLGLAAGGIVFAVHTILLDYSIDSLVTLRAWWYAGWIALIALPCGWYGLMLWYGGFWAGGKSSLYLRHRLWAPGMAALALALACVVAYLNPFRVMVQLAGLDNANVPAANTITPLLLGYPLYLILCIHLALDALRHPDPSGRFMGDEARRRARPWLIASTLVQLATSLFIGGLNLFLFAQAARGSSPVIMNLLPDALDLVEIVVPTMVAVAVVLTGKAVVSFELFSGNALPRGGFWRQWRGVVLSAAAYSVVISLFFSFDIPPIYMVVLAALLLGAFMALWSRGAIAERERSMDILRPFVSSQHFLDGLLGAGENGSRSAAGIDASFEALCRFLGTRRATLHAAGSLAPLAGAPIRYRSDEGTSDGNDPGENLAIDVDAVLRTADAGRLCLPRAAPIAAGESPEWLVPLWSGSRPVGLLVVGDKEDGGVYTREEIEIARAGAERLLDARAGAELAARLMGLQRGRIARENMGGEANQVRRALHDDILPQLHTAMLALSAASPTIEAQESLAQLAEAHRQISDLLRDMPSSAAPEIARLGLLGALQRAFEHELRGRFDAVSWEIGPGFSEAARAMPAASAEIVFYAAREAMRNAAAYGRGPHSEKSEVRPLSLVVRATIESGLCLSIQDDGAGIAAGAVSRGAGQGLALHSTMMAVIGGSLDIESELNSGTRIVLRLREG